VATGHGYGKAALRQGLFAATNVFRLMTRPGRQIPGQASDFLGVELPAPPDLVPKRLGRTVGLVGRVAVAVLDEAWREAGLEHFDPERIGLVVGGSNLQARETLLAQEAHAERPSFVSPHLGYSFLDTDLCGLCAAVFGIRGFACTVGGASASGGVAILQAAEAVRSGRVDACIALGALQDLSYLELHALQVLGAMGPRCPGNDPGQVCRPFDRRRDGFVFGEACAAVVLCRSDLGAKVGGYGGIVGGAHVASGNRGPDPSLAGEIRAIRLALATAGLAPEQIDYVNAHGTGTPLGDDTEIRAYHEVGLTRARINATKSIIGHGIAAAGVVELAAALLQMRDGLLHATRNLEDPIDPTLHWVMGAPERVSIRNLLKLSFGFGGIDTAVVVRAADRP
jgi:malonyl-ACP decarboxylase